MKDLKGLTVQELEDMYNEATEEEKQWMHDNLHLWFEWNVSKW